VVINAIVSICAIIAIALMEWQALVHGIDGTILTLSIAAIAGIAGFNVQKILGVIKDRGKKGE
jgi:hypothetical protein